MKTSFDAFLNITLFFVLYDDAQQSQEKARGGGEGLNLIKVMNDESFHHQTSRVVPRRKFHLMSNGENLPTIATFWNNLWAWMGAWRRRRRRRSRMAQFLVFEFPTRKQEK